MRKEVSFFTERRCGSMCKKVTYTVQRMYGNGSCIIWEHLNGAPVNEYTAFDRGNTFTLYPNRRLMPSPLELKKREISIYETRRAF